MNPVARIWLHLRTQGLARALKHRDFALFSLTGWFSTTGMWMQRVGIGWLTWELTHSGAWLGIMAMANALPGLFLLPLTGAFAERIDPLKLMRVTQVLNLVANTTLAVITLTGHVSVEAMLAITLSTGIVQTFNMPARMTIAPTLVPRNDLPAAISLNSFLFTSAMFIGPAAAGFLIDHGGVGLAFVANACSYLPFYVVLYLIRLPGRVPRVGAKTSLWADAVDGVRYAVRHPGIGPVLLVTVMVSILVRPLSDLVPGFVDEVFKAGPAELGMALSAYGFGGMAGSLWMANRGRIEGTTRVFVVAGLILTAGTALFASLTWFLPAICLMPILGFTNSASNNAAQTLIQGSVAPSHRARVVSLYSLNGRGGPAFGALAMGYLSHVFGLQWPLGVAAVCGVGVVLWAARRRRAIVAASEVMADDRAPPGRKAAE
jgi:MFS family permease